YTGSCLIVKQNGEVKIRTAADKTEVFMAEMTEEEIREYIESGEPMDKAGSYGIQGTGSRFIERIKGNYQTVVGLNTCLLYKTMKEMQII
ncbi:MAG: Maf family protein, partial [Eubacterium sp.]|nr:Maf family protein [Eubacterium sp.]